MAAETLGGRVRRERRAAGLTLAELARRVGRSESHLSRVETGHQRASDELLGALAGAFGVDPDELWLAARRLPGWAAEALAVEPAVSLATLRRWLKMA